MRTPSPSRRRERWDPRLAAHILLRSSPRERGTILLMVVGVLALLAIIGVVYATLGKSDRSAGATNVKAARSAEQVQDVGAYLAGIIADATFATYPELTGRGIPSNPGDAEWIDRVRGYTFPLASRHQISVPPADIARTGQPSPLQPGDTLFEYSLFSPTGTGIRLGDAPTGSGSVTTNWGSFNALDPREYGDPYLAALDPEFLGLSQIINSAGDVANRHDWRSISNFSPRGNFVNLANLRPSRGGFNARPGFTQNMMSYGLTLYNRDTGVPQPVGPQMYPDLDWATGTVTMRQANPLVPAHWTMNQVWAFRPAVADEGYQPSDYEYAFNQWADADGDGFFDSRWFEIADIKDLFGTTPYAKAMLSPRGRARIFVAARCIDSCAMVNVNTATDFTLGGQSFSPTGPGLTRDLAVPPGASPAEINVRRILRTSDVSAGLFASGVPQNDLPYVALPQPRSTTSPELGAADYSVAGNPYNFPAAIQVGGSAYTALLDGRSRGQTEQANHYPAGAVALFPSRRLSGYSIYASPAHAQRYFVNPTTGYGYYGAQAPFDLADELELRAFFGVNDSDTLSRLEATLGGRVQNPVKYRDYSPLRDNRPRSLEMVGRDEYGPTRLFTDYAPNTPSGNRSALLSVFSDVRHLLTTVSNARPIKDGSVAPEFNPDGTIPFGAASTDISAALAAISNYGRFDRAPRASDPERYPNGNTSSLPLDWRLPARDDFFNYQTAVRLIFRLYLNSIAPYTDEYWYPGVWTTVNAGNAAYPPPGSADETFLQGLVYGGNTELAVQMAAHMTANLIDAFDRERVLDLTPRAGLPSGTGRPVVDAGGVENRGRDRTEPVALDLQLCLNPQLTTPRTTNAHKDVQAFPATVPIGAPQVSDDHRLAPSVADLKARNAYPTASGMKKVFGIEPQPFITEVAWYGIYSGDPAQVGVPGGGNGSDLQIPPQAPPPGNSLPFASRQPGQPSVQTIRIETTPDLMGNQDFIGEIIAVQLNNPFDQDVVLYDPRLGPSDAEGAGEPSHPPAPSETRRVDRFKFYFEFAGRYYAFARQKVSTNAAEYAFADDLEARNDPVVLRAGETRVFYFTNPGSLQALTDRANARVGGSSTFTVESIEEWLAGRWTMDGKPELNTNTPSGNGQLFFRNAFNVSSSTFTQRTDGDPAKPQPILQVYPTTFNAVVPDASHGAGFVDMWGVYSRGSGDETLKQAGYSNGGNPEFAPSRRVAHLWRTRRSESSSQEAPYRLGGDLLGGANQDVNDFSNDYLADRLRDPVGDTLDPNLSPSRGSLFEPRVALENAGTVTITHTGSPIPFSLSFVAHGHVRRPTDTDIDPQVPPFGTYPIAKGTTRIDHSNSRRMGTLRGVLPPWCLEVRSDDDVDWGMTRLASKWSLNLGESNPTAGTIANFRVDGPYVAPLAAADTSDTSTFPQPMREHFSSLVDLFGYRGPVNTEIGKPCEQKIGNDIHVNRDLKDYKDVAVEYYDVGEDRLGGAGGEYERITTYIGNTVVTKTVPVRRSRNSALFGRRGDFLLPLAVGPWYDPSREGASQGAFVTAWTGSDPAILDREVQWMTLSESLALSTGYYGPRDTKDPFWRFGQDDPTINRKPRTDRGHLAIDRFSPYLKKGAMEAQPLGSGVPFALGVIDQFRTTPGVSTTPIATTRNSGAPNTVPHYPPGPEGLASSNAFGGGNAATTGAVSPSPDRLSNVTAIPGPINANTMTRNVAATIPMLNPNASEDVWMTLGVPAYVDGNVNYFGLLNTVESYRNNTLRVPSTSGLWPAHAMANQRVSRGDPSASNVEFVRTARGIKSLGEFGMMNYHYASGGVAQGVFPLASMLTYTVPEPTQPSVPNPNGGMAIQAPRLSAHPEVASGGHYDRRPDGRIQDGALAAWQMATPPSSPQTARKWFQQDGTVVTTPQPATPYNILQALGSPQVEHNYQDKLAILNTVTGAASVRSDVFTVYFLVHAYTPEDVDVPDSQPMVPSMAKRFVMVVDRSNVKSLGDKPKVLLLKEVPTN